MRVIKQIKVLYYLKSYFRRLLPAGNYKKRIKNLEKKFTHSEILSLEHRIQYYCKSSISSQRETSTRVKFLQNPISPKTYYHDTFEYARFFDKNLPIHFVFGDVVEVPAVPSIVKSRPISHNNQNSVLLNLDKARHFVWIKNDKNFLDKKNLMIGRCAVFQHHRHLFFEKYFNHPLCDLGQVNTYGGNLTWLKPKISIKKHLDYKFILSLEGNDVATNLKWIMSSNSIAVMPKPKYETWFMEGKLVGGKHYIEIKDDFSDLEKQLNFYIENPGKCLEIIRNANLHCKQFYDKRKEEYCSLRVLEKYFNYNIC